MSSHKAFIATEHGAAVGRNDCHGVEAGARFGLGPRSTTMAWWRWLAATENVLQRSITAALNVTVDAPRPHVRLRQALGQS
jgi:hypothetical protein